MAQTCCGQAHYNTGYRHEAEPLARHFSDVFGEYEAIVTPSGSCGAMVRELYPRMGERPGPRGAGTPSRPRWRRWCRRRTSSRSSWWTCWA
jgi:L-lactate dehydrogenase complex protein LldE